MKKINVACVGLGCRGQGMLKTILKMCDNVDVLGVCDLYEDRVQKGIEMVEEFRGHKPFGTTNSDEIMKMENIDAVLIFAYWEAHVDLAVAAMNHGKYVGLEVGGAYSLDDCYRLVRAYEETKMPCMLLENCCYGKTELMVLNMVREGIFGEVVHCSGGYHHYLCEEIAGGDINRHYRLRNYLSRNCENYPTHELGPIAKVLDINRGNRMMTLTSVASKARGMESYINDNSEKYADLVGKRFNQGDIVTTIITCADGSTITLTLDTTLPRAYSRGFTVRGTKAAYFEENNSLFIDDPEKRQEMEWNWKKYWDNGEEFKEKYPHPLWEKYGKKAADAGHDGMDYMVLSAFFESVEKNALPPIDVYDAASWMCITTLSEDSIAKGGAPVNIPDFTNGKWAMYKKTESELEFALD